MIPIDREEFRQRMKELEEELKDYISEHVEALRKAIVEEVRKNAGKYRRTGS